MNELKHTTAQPPAESPALRSLMRFYEAEARYSGSGKPADRDALLNTLSAGGR